MERLPYIDVHSRIIAAAPELVWRELLLTLRTLLGRELPRPLTAAWGLEQTKRQGDWRATVEEGDTLTGFAVLAADPARELTLRGRHHFSSYELRFELAPAPNGAVELRATTSAVFPGARGSVYRLLVIGTGGHRIIVRRMLSRTARGAER